MKDLADMFSKTLHKIGMNHIKHPVFYNAPVGIRFEIGGDDKLLKEIIKADIGGCGALASSVYFLDKTNFVLFHLYDDRGLDLVAADKELLRPIFEHFNNWILDYDKEQINKTFEK